MNSQKMMKFAARSGIGVGGGVLLTGLIVAGWNDRNGGAALMQAGAAIISFSMMAMMPVQMAEKAEKAEKAKNEAIIRRILKASAAFFSAFDKTTVFLETKRGDNRPVLTADWAMPVYFNAPRNWAYFQETFAELANEYIDDIDVISLVECLCDAASKLNAGYQGLEWKAGVTALNIAPFSSEYRNCVDDVETARNEFEKLKKSHPNLAPRDPKKTSEELPVSSSSQSSAEPALS